MIPIPALEPGWARFLEPETTRPYFQKLSLALEEEREAGHGLRPDPEHIFRALELCPFSLTRVVILGQDPYPGPNQADGLAFSVPPLQPLPASLRHILKEMSEDLGVVIPRQGNLDSWARQGVLLLNTSLTVRCGQPNSHRNIGWRMFTDSLISWLSLQKDRLFFILWGREAQAKIPLLDQNKHGIHCSAHPSPLSVHRGFRGSRPFSRANRWLTECGLAPINWESINHPHSLK